jgi:phage recombination protein Bet
MTTEVELWQAAYGELDPEVRDRWALEQIKTIRATVAKDLNAAEFRMGMSIAAKYQLDPLLKEIWFAKSAGRNGAEGRVLIMVGRDGLMRNAERHEDYRGFDTDVVRENDRFKVVRLPTGERSIEHEYEGGPEARGPIVGAWAIVQRIGRPSTYFFAPMSEYKPSSSSSYSPWSTQPSVMIQKCALSLCFRLAFNLSGVIGEDEGARATHDAGFAAPAPDNAAAGAQLMQAVPESLRERFSAAWREAKEVIPGRYTTSAAAMSLSGQPLEKVLEYVEKIEADVADERPAYEERKAAEAQVTDAEVVKEDARTEPPTAPAVETSATASEPALDGEVQPEQDAAEPATQPRMTFRHADEAAVDPSPDLLRARLSKLYDERTDEESKPEPSDGVLEALEGEISFLEDQLASVNEGEPIDGQTSMLDGAVTDAS